MQKQKLLNPDAVTDNPELLLTGERSVDPALFPKVEDFPKRSGIEFGESVEASLVPDRVVEELVEITGADYEYAKDSGLLERFFYDDNKGQAIIHILVGNVHDGHISGGHHGSSIDRVPDSRAAQIETESLSGQSKLNRTTRRNLRHEPEEWAPGRKLVAIFGELRTAINDNGEERIMASSLFPEAIDAFSILKMINHAYETRSPEEEAADNGQELMVDKDIELPNGSMRIKIVADKETDKIITAYPVIKHSTAATPTKEQVVEWIDKTEKD